jgi:RNA polymerase sigma-70 factor (ECF subfamily)
MTEVLTGEHTPAGAHAVTGELERHRRELTGYCYRMLGSAFEAEDAVQDTLLRAWRAADRFENRSSVRSWLFRIATNVCFDVLAGRQRRARPMDLGPSAELGAAPGGQLPEVTWITPIPDGRVLPHAGDPAEAAVAGDSIRLAFVAALQHLPPRQRAVLVLREVLSWSAAEVAALLGTTVPSVNSALQRARATLAAREVSLDTQVGEGGLDQADRALLARYLDAFQRYDMVALTELIHEDATQSMPPYSMWLRGRESVLTFWAGPGAPCAGSHLVATTANGSPAFAQYRPSGPGGAFEPWALQVLEVREGRVHELTFFLDVDRVFPLFGLPRVPVTA